MLISTCAIKGKVGDRKPAPEAGLNETIAPVSDQAPSSDVSPLLFDTAGVLKRSHTRMSSLCRVRIGGGRKGRG